MKDSGLPPPCDPEKHQPAILHRSRRGGDDSMYRNFCGICGREILRADESEAWKTEEQRTA